MATVRDLSGNSPIGTGVDPEIVAASLDTSGLASDDSIQDLITEVQATNTLLNTPAAELPPTPLSDDDGMINTQFQFSTAATHSLVALDATQRPLVYELYFQVVAGVAGTVTVSDGTTEFLEIDVTTAGGVFHRQFNERVPAFDTVINKQLSLIATTAMTIKGNIIYKMGVA